MTSSKEGFSPPSSFKEALQGPPSYCKVQLVAPSYS